MHYSQLKTTNSILFQSVCQNCLTYADSLIDATVQLKPVASCTDDVALTGCELVCKSGKFKPTAVRSYAYILKCVSNNWAYFMRPPGGLDIPKIMGDLGANYTLFASIIILSMLQL
jgi:hypothetical protein